MAFALLLTFVATANAAPRGSTVAPFLTLACHILGGGYAIKDPDGTVVENGDGAAFAPTPPSFIRIDAARRTISVAGTVLPHPAGAPGPVFIGLRPVRFGWGSATYDVTQDGGGFTIRSTSSSAIGAGPQSGRIMDAFTVGSCVAIPASRFP